MGYILQYTRYHHGQPVSRSDAGSMGVNSPGLITIKVVNEVNGWANGRVLRNREPRLRDRDRVIRDPPLICIENTF